MLTLRQLKNRCHQLITLLLMCRISATESSLHRIGLDRRRCARGVIVGKKHDIYGGESILGGSAHNE